MSFYRQNYLGFNISHFGTALPCATGPPAAARPRQVHPTRQTKVYGERTGPNAKLGERGASKGAIPDPRYGGGSLKHGNPNTIQQ